MRKSILPFIFLVVVLPSTYSQVNLQVLLKMPLPYELSAWIADPNVLQLVITNATANNYPSATVRIIVMDDNGKVLLRTKENSAYIPRVYIPAAGAIPSQIVLTGSQIINVNALEYDRDVERTLITSGSIPEGTYQLCISVYDQFGVNITLGDEYCTTIQTLVPEPPQIVSPTEDEVLQTPFPIFRWVPVTSYNFTRSTVNYKIKICPVWEGQSPRDALERNPVLFEKSGIQTSFLQPLPGELHFDYYQNVNRFVWIVQAFDATGKPATKNQGKSELATFRLRETVSEDNTLTLEHIYPAQNDTLPWSTPQLFIRLAPCDDDIRSVIVRLTVRSENSSSTIHHVRTIRFPQGPRQSQQLVDGEKAGILLCNVDDAGTFPSWMQTLAMGKQYFWRVEATVTKHNGQTLTARSSETSFTIGLKKPREMECATNSVVTSGTPIEVSFRVQEPSVLNFLYPELLRNPYFNGYNALSTATANVAFELSKRKTFDSLLSQVFVRIPEGVPYTSGDRCEALFQPIRQRFSPLRDTGQYYWRVRFLDNHTATYAVSAVDSFRLVPDSARMCFDMFIEQPKSNGVWTSGLNPTFAVSVKPVIRKSAITGGRFRIWKMNSPTQNITDAKQSTPVLDTSFSGNGALYQYSTDMQGFTRYDINLLNSDSTSKTFSTDSNATYVWNFMLKYNRDSVRADGGVCALDSVVSADGLFQVKVGEDENNACPGDCFADVPTNKTPGTQTLAKDSVLSIGKFTVTLTSVSGTPASLSGEGTVDVQFLRAPIRVEFNNIKVNSENQVYEGAIFAKVDPAAGYSMASKEEYEGKVLGLADGILKSIYEKSKSAGRLVSALINTSPTTLPLGFDKAIDGYPTVIAILGMMFTPTQAVLNAATWVDLPALGPDVGFGLGAKNICFHKAGLAGMDKAVLYLARDFGYRREGSWSILFKASTLSDSGTFAAWDCKGFSHLVVSAEVDFPRSWLVNTRDSSSSVKALFKGRAEKNGNGWQWMMTSSLNECEFAQLPGFTLNIPSLVFDFSTSRNPEGITFPESYTNTSAQWKGFFLKSATIRLPDRLRTFDGVNPELALTNVIIDGTGITGKLYAQNVIHYPRVNFGGWGGSIDTLRIEMVSSSLRHSEMKGRIKISITDTLFEYVGTISRPAPDSGSTAQKGLQYQFSINPRTDIPIPLSCLKCTLNLASSSSITMTYGGDGFLGEANFSGVLKVDSSIDFLSKIGLQGIEFSDWKVRTATPRFERGRYEFASPQHSVAGFPVTITNIDIETGERHGRFAAALKFTVDVNLQSGTNGVRGGTTLKIWTALASEDGPQRFVYDGVELDSIGIDADVGAVKVQGGLNLFSNDPTFGNGFRGTVRATFLEKLMVGATAQFGAVNDHRYWYVDAKALLPAGAPLFTGFGVYGFAGGAWYGMRRSGSVDASALLGSTDSSTSSTGTGSGFQYAPDRNASFGFSGTLVVGTHPSAESFNGDVGLEAQFSSTGGLSSMSLTGSGYILCGIAERQKAKILSDVNLTYYVPTRTLDGNLNVRIVNADPLTGGGRAVIHFDPNLWYIKIGEPAQPCSLRLSNWLQANAYIMTGMQLPTPQLPPELQQYQGLVQNRSIQIREGNGFAFGASQRFQTGKQQYLVFTGDISALYGFDMSLLKYDGVTCEGTSTPLGINGWYASGKIYAYLNAVIGMHIETYFYEGDKKILDLTLASVLQGGAPNPTWIKGMVSGNYSVLGGAIKGRCEYRFSIGEQCQMMAENPLSRIDIISELDPTNGQRDVDVAIEPQVAFNFKLNTPFDIEEMPDGSGKATIRTFRVKIDPLSLQDLSAGKTIGGNIVESPDGFAAFYKPNEMLGSQHQYRFSASAYGEELINGSWSPAKRKDGSVIKQQEAVVFVTGTAPDKIEPQHIAYTYPIEGQQYFLQGECRSGRIQLKTGMAYLFQPRENYDVQFIARFVPEDRTQPALDVPFTYNGGSATIVFDIPTLLRNTTYQLLIIRKEVPNDPNLARLVQGMERMQSSGGVPSGQQTIREREVYNVQGSTVLLGQRMVQSPTHQFGERVLYAYTFKTSRFNTLQEKLSTFRQTTIETETSGMFQRQAITFSGTEPFDRYDCVPVLWTSCGAIQKFGPLVKLNAWQRTSQWHTQFVNPAIYDEVMWMKNRGFWNGQLQYEKSAMELGVPFGSIGYEQNLPLFVVGPSSTSSTQSKSTSAQSSSQNMKTSGNSIVLKVLYNHGTIVPTDYLTVKERALAVLSNPFISKTNSDRTRLNAIVNRSYQLMYRGTYPIGFFYNYNGCQAVDATIIEIAKPFTY
ncbi:MAG: hypothetical protein N3A63_07900 [Bacteroidetes bacterium]|nr:hypothetical protein [Bacteroidota bacterium]